VGSDNRWTRTAGGGSGGEPYANLGGNDRKALTYTTEALGTDLEVTGHPVAHLWITSSAADGDVFVYLEEVLPDGRSVMVTEGMLRASHRALAPAPYRNLGLPWHPSRAADIAPLEPGVPAELVLDLMPTSVLFHRGSRIRVVVTAADEYTFRTARGSPPPTIRVLRDADHPSRIILPVIPR
jgi:putative CocE/NonD family hydrolase